MTSGERRAIDKMSSRRRRTKRDQKGFICGWKCSSVVSDKLIALKSLIPTTEHRENIVKADQLFQETANYILHLKSQVFLLQTLIDLYGSTDHQVQIDSPATTAPAVLN